LPLEPDQNTWHDTAQSTDATQVSGKPAVTTAVLKTSTTSAGGEADPGRQPASPWGMRQRTTNVALWTQMNSDASPKKIINLANIARHNPISLHQFHSKLDYPLFELENYIRIPEARRHRSLCRRLRPPCAECT